jgi:hypothetical protein
MVSQVGLLTASPDFCFCRWLQLKSVLAGQGDSCLGGAPRWLASKWLQVASGVQREGESGRGKGEAALGSALTRILDNAQF